MTRTTEQMESYVEYCKADLWEAINFCYPGGNYKRYSQKRVDRLKATLTEAEEALRKRSDCD